MIFIPQIFFVCSFCHAWNRSPINLIFQVNFLSLISGYVSASVSTSRGAWKHSEKYLSIGTIGSFFQTYRCPAWHFNQTNLFMTKILKFTQVLSAATWAGIGKIIFDKTKTYSSVLEAF